MITRAWNRTVLVLGLIRLPLAMFAAEPDVGSDEMPRLAPIEPRDALATFQLRPGFEIELAAAEPLVMDPIAVAFDADSRLYVVEMRGYSERRDAGLDRVSLLEDRDGDGRYDVASRFAEGLAWPTGIACWNGGVLVAATPDLLFLRDTDGDGKADERRVIFTGFADGVARLNVQALPNNLTWTLDNRVRGATSFNGGRLRRPGVAGEPALELSGRDFSFDPRTLSIRAESGGGQHGMAIDDFGTVYVCSNSRHIQQVLCEDRYVARNPVHPFRGPLVDIAEDGPAAEVYRISPDEPWRIVRTRWRVAGVVSGPVEGGGRVSGYFTAATGISIYRGDAWPEEYRGDAFIGDAGSNLVHHKKLKPAGVAFQASRPADEQGVEFLASTDNWFRPVQLANGPDGCLYVVDMYREVIEHPWSIPPSIKQHLDLNSGHDRGRIYRIRARGWKRPDWPRVAGMNSLELASMLEHPNGWHRDTAARLLYERRDPSVGPVLESMARSSTLAAGRVQALYALSGAGRLTSAVLRDALRDRDARVRRQAVRLSEPEWLGQATLGEDWWSELLARAEDPDPSVRYQLALTLGAFRDPSRLDALFTLMRQDAREEWMETAIFSALGTNAAPETMTDSARLFVRMQREEEMREDPRWSSWRRHLAALAIAAGGPRDVDAFARAWHDLNRWSLRAELWSAIEEGLRRTSGNTDEIEARMKWDRMVADAADAAMESGADPVERIGAIRIAAIGRDGALGERLFEWLPDAAPDSVRRAALDALAGYPEDWLLPRLEARWSKLSREEHDHLLNLLLPKPSTLSRLMDAAATGLVPVGDWSAAIRTALRTHRDAQVRAKAERLFPAPGPGKADVRNWTEALTLRGDAGRGGALFLERCASCHRLGDDGHAAGPDLATVRSAGKEKILTSIVEPNREVAPNFIQYEILTRDGERLDGMIASETASSVTMRQAQGLETVLLRTAITGMRSAGRSMMPEGLVDDLSAARVADLLEYVLSGSHEAGKSLPNEDPDRDGPGLER